MALSIVPWVGVQYFVNPSGVVAVFVGYKTAYHFGNIAFQRGYYLLEVYPGFNEQGFAHILQNVGVAAAA